MIYKNMIDLVNEYRGLIINKAIEVNNELSHIYSDIDPHNYVSIDYCEVIDSALEMNFDYHSITLSYTDPYESIMDAVWEVPYECLDMSYEELVEYANNHVRSVKDSYKTQLLKTIENAQRELEGIGDEINK